MSDAEIHGQPPALQLDGHSLTCETLEAAANGNHNLRLAEDGLTRMRASRAIIDDVIARKVPVYGVTTGLGARAGEALSETELTEFSLQTIRGRAHAIGPLLKPEQVRAALVTRLNTLLIGASGASPQLAQGLCRILNAGMAPAVGEYGSIGASDLILGATAALALIGEGKMLAGSCSGFPALEALKTAGVSPLVCGPRDGLALANHAGFSAGFCALGVARAARLFEALQSAASLSLEGFRANLSPFLSPIIALKGQDGEAEAARGILNRLSGSLLLQNGSARRLQDPLSLRNIPQVHGATLSALVYARSITETELNGSSDNPAALIEEGKILSTGNYLTPHLTNGVETLNRALVHATAMQIARLSKLLSARFTDLPLFLAGSTAGSSGFAPVMKSAEALQIELLAAATPAAVWPSLSADGVEDVMASSFTAAKGLMRGVELAERLTAIELMVAAQSVELRELGDDLAPWARETIGKIRTLSSPLTLDRPLTDDIERLANAVNSGSFSAKQK